MVVIIGTSQFHILMLHLGLLESLDIQTISDCLNTLKFKVYNLERLLIDSSHGIDTILLVGFSFPHFSYKFHGLDRQNTNLYVFT